MLSFIFLGMTFLKMTDRIFLSALLLSVINTCIHVASSMILGLIGKTAIVVQLSGELINKEWEITRVT